MGQTHLLRVDLERPDVTTEELRALFEAAYFRRFRVELADIRALVVNANTSVIGTRAALDLSALIDPAGRAETLAEARTGTRAVRFDAGVIETPVYWRDRMPVDFMLEGPAIVEQMDTTVLIEPGDVVRGDAQGNLIVEIAQ